jgi:hypothetical protein
MCDVRETIVDHYTLLHINIEPNRHNNNNNNNTQTHQNVMTAHGDDGGDDIGFGKGGTTAMHNILQLDNRERSSFSRPTIPERSR